jgi:hypothetical protein
MVFKKQKYRKIENPQPEDEEALEEELEKVQKEIAKKKKPKATTQVIYQPIFLSNSDIKKMIYEIYVMLKAKEDGGS